MCCHCRLRQLPPSLHHFPCAAVYVKLAGFKPANVSSEMERIPYRPEWSMKAMLEMIDLLNGELTAVVTVRLIRSCRNLSPFTPGITCNFGDRIMI